MSMSAFERFEKFYAHFRKTELWKAMAMEKEGTAWHREANVGKHTDMLLEWYKTNLASQRNEYQRILTMTACLMHDVGKPPSKIRKERNGEIVNAYHGHELVSARIWTNYAVTEPKVKDLLMLSSDDISFIALMIEHHVPFAIEKAAKRKALKASFMERRGEQGHRAWLDLLLSDQHGRISDDQATKLKAVDQWMHGWTLV